ncbi:monodehydroascorbate reductase, chloroplastic/mitochondrial-like isoform X2 [Olea europaea var. sylvestris]|uniref:monodehydroascorbate reductase, chloroplastic/mitochondrial-like isoform X2 n=1 Tax=Olea europaea var. sylvestris TaxID=158386 RepID=UPI000C1D0BCC|nr:monodehydroascorbate reductase, chloroplastic/mitochondrial-like isoform X2 [Olea europaea var. sylvestris]
MGSQCSVHSQFPRIEFIRVHVHFLPEASVNASLSLLPLSPTKIGTGGNAAGYAARTFVEHGLANGKLCIVSKEEESVEAGDS